MEGWEWVIGISVAIVAVAFVCLVIFLITTLLSLKKSLECSNQLIQNTNDVVIDVEKKLHALDPVFHAVSDLGNVAVRNTANIKSLSDEVASAVVHDKKMKVERVVSTAMEVFDWTLMGVALWQKIKESRR